MKKVLIVLKDVVLLSALKRWYSHIPKKELLFFAKDAKKALDLIRAEAVDLVITELNLPEIDGVELIAGLVKEYPAVQLAVFLEMESMSAEDCLLLKTFSSVYFLLQPHTVKEFTSALKTLEVVAHQAPTVAEINIGDFFKLIEYQRKTCLITVENLLTSQKGLVYFEQGVLYDAIHGILKWDAAVLEMLTWSKTLVAFKPLNNKHFRRKVFTSLSDLIFQGQQPEHKDDLDFLIDNVLAEADARLDLEKNKIKSKQAENEVKEESAAVEASFEVKEQQATSEQVVEVVVATESVDANTVLKSRFNGLDLNDILVSLQELDGYLASVVFDIDGNLFIQHQLASAHIEMPVKKMAVLIPTLTTAISNIRLGQSNFCQLNCNQGIFQAVWELEDQFIAALLLKTQTKDTSLARIKLLKVYETIQKQLLS